MSDPAPPRQRVVLSHRDNPAVIRARTAYAELPWWRRLFVRAMKGWR